MVELCANGQIARQPSARLAIEAAVFACALASCTEPKFDVAPGASMTEDAGADQSGGEDSGERSPAPQELGGDAEAANRDGAIEQVDSALRDAAASARDASVDAARPAVQEVDDASRGAANDAASASDAQLPAWVRPLLGTYAKRTVTFSYDDAPNPPLNTRNVDHSIVRITDEGGALRVTSQMCSFTATLKGQGTAPLSLRYPERYPAMEGELKLHANNTFSSDAMLQHLGFDPARGDGCGATGRRDKFADQTWISGSSCQCYPIPVPENIDDCAVIDGDGDGMAGITVRGPSPLGTTVSEYLMVFDSSIRIVDGTVTPAGLPAWREVRGQAPACINTARDRCSIGNNELCPGETTTFLRLEAGATCASLNQGDFGPLDNFPVEVDCRSKP